MWTNRVGQLPCWQKICGNSFRPMRKSWMMPLITSGTLVRPSGVTHIDPTRLWWLGKLWTTTVAAATGEKAWKSWRSCGLRPQCNLDVSALVWVSPWTFVAPKLSSLSFSHLRWLFAPLCPFLSPLRLVPFFCLLPPALLVEVAHIYHFGSAFFLTYVFRPAGGWCPSFPTICLPSVPTYLLLVPCLLLLAFCGLFSWVFLPDYFIACLFVVAWLAGDSLPLAYLLLLTFLCIWIWYTW